MEYPYFKGLEADRYSFYRVPKALVKADLFQKMSGDAKLLYAVLLGSYEPFHQERLAGQARQRLHYLHDRGSHGLYSLCQTKGSQTAG